MKKTTKIINCICLLVLFICFGLSAKTVRVGYTNLPGFIEENEDGSFRGYAVEYLDHLKDYTDWEIEYVQAPLYEQFKMVINGELDLVPMAIRTKQTQNDFLFSHQSLGLIQCLLLTLPSRTDIENNAISCDGKTIGVCKGSYLVDLIKRYASDMGFSFTAVEYDYQAQMEQALFDGEVDIIASGQMVGNQELRILDYYGSEPFYIATNKENTQLMDEVNYALSSVNSVNPTLRLKLYEEFFGNGFLSEKPYFSKAEAEFIANTPKVTVGLLANNRPGVYFNNEGELTGIIVDALKKVEEISGLDFVFDFIPQEQAPLDYIKEHPTYIAAGMLASNPAFNTPEVLTTSSLHTTSSSLVVRKDVAEKIDISNKTYTIGTTSNFQAMLLFIEQNYPNLEIKTYLTVDEGLKAVLDKKLDLFAYNSHILSPLISNPRYGDLTLIESLFNTSPTCAIALNVGNGPIIVSIINKCLASMSNETFSEIENKHLRLNVYHYNASDTWYRYRVQILIVGVIVLGLITCLAVLLFARQRRFTIDSTYKAEHEMMTNLYNRIAAKEKIVRIIKNKTTGTCAFIIIDIDKLKSLNDTYGHAAGDFAITSLANILKEIFNSTEIIGRIGGDEFCVFVPDVVSVGELTLKLDKLIETINNTQIVNTNETLASSIGVALSTEENRLSSDELYRFADIALYESKNKGKNTYTFYEKK